jgi:hypothetical protein
VEKMERAGKRGKKKESRFKERVFEEVEENG